MQRPVAILVLALAVLALPALSAEHFDAPMHFYEPARIGLYLPGDTEIAEEEGVWYAFSESAGMQVTFEEAETYVAPKNISEDAVTEAFADWDIQDFTFLFIKQNDAVTFAYGQGMVEDEEGQAYEGYFGILTNADVKKKTFVFSVTAESLVSPETGPAADEVLSDIYSMDPM